jgi:hypothetical protein
MESLRVGQVSSASSEMPMTEWLKWIFSFGWVPAWIKDLDPLVGVGSALIAVLIWYYNSRRKPALQRKVARLERLLRQVDILRRNPDRVAEWKRGRTRFITVTLFVAFALASVAAFIASETWRWVIYGMEVLLAGYFIHTILWNSRVSSALGHWPEKPAAWIHGLVEVKMRQAGFSDREWALTLDRLFQAAGKDKALEDKVLRLSLSHPGVIR